MNQKQTHSASLASQPRKAYAGIGSRKTPSDMLKLMEQVGQAFARLGWMLRSGNCQGADQAFQSGANAVNPKLVELYLPWPGYESSAIQQGNAVHTPGSQAFAQAARLHPAWDKLGRGVRAMHARNVELVLGVRLVKPVACLVCWTPRGRETGGTAQGIRVAKELGVPVWNLATPGGLCEAERVLCKAGLAGHVKQGQMCFEF